MKIFVILKYLIYLYLKGYVFSKHEELKDQIQSDNMIPQLIFKRNLNGYFIDYQIGSLVQKGFFFLELTQEYNWLHKYLLYPFKSKTMESKGEVIIEIDNKKYKEELYTDNFSFGNNYGNTFDNFSLNKFPFLVFKSQQIFSIEKPVLGLAYCTLQSNFSITNQLKIAKKIEKRKFTFINYDEDKFYGMIVFGEINHIPLLKTNYYSTSCKVIKSVNKATWGCKLKEVLFTLDKKEYHYINKHNFIFHTNSSKFYVPEDFFIFLSDILIEDEGNHQLGCEIIKSFQKKRLKCDCKITVFLLGIKFRFDNDYLYHIPDISYRDFGKCSLSIEYDENNPNDWLVGYSFFDYYITSFDNDNDEIIFYSELPFNYYGKDFNLIKLLFIVIMCIIIYAIIILLLLCLNLKKGVYYYIIE